MNSLARPRVQFLEAGSVLLVGVAAAMWAFDAYFRPGLTKQLSSGQIVLVEDLLISLCLVPVLALNADEQREEPSISCARTSCVPWVQIPTYMAD